MGRTSAFHESDGDYRKEAFMENGSPLLPLYRLQSSLPRLPVPTLDETFARYLLSVQPLATSEEYERTVRAVREFLRPGGLVSCTAGLRRQVRYKGCMIRSRLRICSSRSSSEPGKLFAHCRPPQLYSSGYEKMGVVRAHVFVLV